MDPRILLPLLLTLTLIAPWMVIYCGRRELASPMVTFPWIPRGG